MHGWLIYAFEIGLIAIFLFHIVAAVTVAWIGQAQRAPAGYKYAAERRRQEPQDARLADHDHHRASSSSSS